MNLLKEPFKSLKVPVKIKYSLTERKAAVFVQIANLFTDTKTYLIKPPLKVDAKSIITILNLNCQNSETIFIETQGPQADLAVISLIKSLSEPTGQIAKDTLHQLKGSQPVPPSQSPTFETT
ncbi:MAG: HPr family phosphocarrier protein [Candidatus Omnitrophica bacterium]|nr:HPr family phosphocarrier protein [Candidatus Omnitrophota bacterium]